MSARTPRQDSTISRSASARENCWSRRWLRLCAPIVKPSACNWRSCALVEVGLDALKVSGGSMPRRARRPRQRLLAAGSCNNQCSSGREPWVQVRVQPCESERTRGGRLRQQAPGCGRNRAPRPSSVTIASTWAKGSAQDRPDAQRCRALPEQHPVVDQVGHHEEHAAHAAPLQQGCDHGCTLGEAVVEA